MSQGCARVSVQQALNRLSKGHPTHKMGKKKNCQLISSTPYLSIPAHCCSFPSHETEGYSCSCFIARPQPGIAQHFLCGTQKPQVGGFIFHAKQYRWAVNGKILGCLSEWLVLSAESILLGKLNSFNGGGGGGGGRVLTWELYLFNGLVLCHLFEDILVYNTYPMGEGIKMSSSWHCYATFQFRWRVVLNKWLLIRLNSACIRTLPTTLSMFEPILIRLVVLNLSRAGIHLKAQPGISYSPSRILCGRREGTKQPQVPFFSHLTLLQGHSTFFSFQGNWKRKRGREWYGDTVHLGWKCGGREEQGEAMQSIEGLPWQPKVGG